MTKEYNVVLVTLQREYDALAKMGHKGFGVMDHIRNEQMQELKAAMEMWEQYNHEC